MSSLQPRSTGRTVAHGDRAHQARFGILPHTEWTSPGTCDREGVYMEIQLEALKVSVRTVHAHAMVLAADGRPDEGEVAYATLFQVVSALFADPPDEVSGWPRVVPVLTRLSVRLGLDALAASRLGQMQVRAATLLDLPKVTTLATMADIGDVIDRALATGKQREASGDIRGCCTVYWAAGQALLAAHVTRGIPGYTKALAPIRQVHEAEPPTRTLDPGGLRFYARTLQLAFGAAVPVAG